MSYRYETHLHTRPVSKCGKATVEETLQFYASLGYDGVFLTNHFLDANINISSDLPYEERLDFYYSDEYHAKELAPKYGIRVFSGVELSYGGSDFLIYGLDEAWFKDHPEIMDMKKSEELPFLMEAGALVVHAHPFREAGYIDHIRLYPRQIQAVEVINACRTDFENRMAELYAREYGFAVTAGSDNHVAERIRLLGGVETDTPLADERDYIERVLSGRIRTFLMENPLWKE